MAGSANSSASNDADILKLFPGTSTCHGPEVAHPATFCVHEVWTSLCPPKKKKKGVMKISGKSECIILAVNESVPDVLIPNLDYCDPLNMWSIITKVYDLSQPLVIGEATWIHSKLPKFGIFLSNESGELQTLPIEFKNDDARALSSTGIEFWAHGGRVKTLYNHLIDHDESRDSLIEIAAKYFRLSPSDQKEPTQKDFVKQFHESFLSDTLPTAFAYPVLGMSLSHLPKPNKVGYVYPLTHVNSCVSNPKGDLMGVRDNRSHIKFSLSGCKPCQVTDEVMVELLGLARDMFGPF